MTMLAAKLFLRALEERLNAPFGGNLAPGNAAERLAREFRGGEGALRDALAQEAADTNERGRKHCFSLCESLMSVWVGEKDSHDLKMATGFSREQWLDAPIWQFNT